MRQPQTSWPGYWSSCAGIQQVLERLVDEVDAGGSALRQATIYEAQRIRPSIEASFRRTKTRIRLGDWVLPEGIHVMVNFQLAHESADELPRLGSFNPDRFLEHEPEAVSVDAVRWRRKPLSRCVIREHGDGHRTAHTAPRIPVRADQCAG